MVNFPTSLDNDSSIQRADDNLSELNTDIINQLRDAVFAIQQYLGLGGNGSLTSISDRIDVSILPNGNIRSSAFTSVGLATLPIDNAQVGSGAGILESKLALDYGTSNLNAQIQVNTGTLNTLASFTSVINSNLLSHISGANLADGSNSKHVASLIDLNTVPFDTRDPFFIWDGLIDKNGNQRTAQTVAQALLQINDEFVQHQLDITGQAHFASGINVDTSDFTVIPQSADTVQKALDAIDAADSLVIQQHQQNLHANGVPRKSRSSILNDVDGYSYTVIPSTPATALLSYVDNNTTGNDIISFNPNNSGFAFDEKFAKVQIGDQVRINYGNGTEAIFMVESKRHIPGSEWIVRINGVNLANADGYSAYASITKRRFDTEKYGVLAVAPANNDINPLIMGSVIVGNPMGAQVLGIDFDPTHLDSSHYNLYLALYPTGNPADAVIELPAIDVTGNQGITPGKYTLSSVIQTVNDKFRAGGYNYRFIAFERNGNFGLQLADIVSNVSFSIITGSLSSGTLITGAYTNNVIGDAVDGKDALGLGSSKAGFGSPIYSGSYSSGLVASSFPTVIIPPLAKRHYVANGISRDSFAQTYLAPDGYWDGYISNRVVVGISTVETTYHVNLDLSAAELKPGKTILIQPAIARDDSLFNDVDYGRFIIKEITFSDCSCDTGLFTSITVINSIHSTGSVISSSATPNLPVKIYFSEDSVSFNQSNVSDAINGNQYIRYHEIYITDEGKTFSHERARMPQQVETVSLLGTSKFRINEISPKLGGYIDTGASDFDKFIRFYVLNYDSVSGEFDGYIGRAEPSGAIEEYGRIIKARKNVATRFYDSSDIDFIEIEYIEDDQYPGTSILSTNVSRYVDIQIFDTLATNQDVFRLASCNLIQNRIYNVRDLREFGNVSEMDLTDSCIRFIESGDRYLHENGVIQGFSFIGLSSPGHLAFNGGLALINGHISTLNSCTIRIPEIVQDTGGSQINVLDWAICINDKNLLQAIPLTSVRQQFFARRISDSDNYYIQSCTFQELSTRKDLCVISVCTVTIASTTVNLVQDARKHVLDVDIPTVCTLDGYEATFKTFEAMAVWARAGLLDNVKLNRGTIEQEVNLLGVPSKMTIHGSNHEPVIVTSSIGIKANSNVYYDNANFVYNSTFTGLGSDVTHVDTNYACVLFDARQVDIKNISIKNSLFSRTVAGERPPFAMFLLRDDGYASNICLSRNEFQSGADDIANPAIAFYHNSFATTTVSDLEISFNKVSNSGCILLASANVDSGLKLYNVDIGNNDLPNGMIGYNMTGSDGYLSQSSGISIHDNKASVIAFVSADGEIDVTATSIYGTGIAKIQKNTCSFIAVKSRTTRSVGYPRDNMIISDNILIGRSSAVTAYGAYWGLGGPTSALLVGTSADGYNHYINIYGNTILSEDFTYYRGISANGTIHNNIIDGFTNTGISSNGLSRIYENTIKRNGNEVDFYIASTNVNSRVYDNVLDSPYVSDSTLSVGTINATGYVHRNVNHVKSVYLSFNGCVRPSAIGNDTQNLEYRADATNQLAMGSDRINSIISTSNSSGGSGESCVINIDSTGSGDANLNAQFRLQRHIPYGTNVVGAIFSWDATNALWSSGTIQLLLFEINNTTPILSSSLANLTSASGTLGIIDYTNTSKSESSFIKIEIKDAVPSSADKNLTIIDLEVLYMD